MIFDGFIQKDTQSLILALTPTERWQAARIPRQGLLTNHWFILVCVVVMVALAVGLFWVSLRRVRQEHMVSDRVFIELAGEKLLTVRECQILQRIAKHSGVPRQESVFTDRAAFERGADQMIAHTLSDKEPQKKQHLFTELSLLREKIGFGREYAALGATQSRSRSSREISMGKLVTLQPVPADDVESIEAVVHRNMDHELCVKPQDAIKVRFGGLWTVRYYSSASVWEFETSVSSYDGTVLALAHSDHVRFLNRRRFLRVPVKRRALIAKFPFEQVFRWPDAAPPVRNEPKETALAHPIEGYGSPEFLPATVTELGGTGLRIETSLALHMGARVLVVFDLDVEPLVSVAPSYIDRQSRLIEGIGEVRHVKQVEEGVSVAVELRGLKEADINELIRATNAALIDINQKKTAVGEHRSGSVTQAVAV
ncbi:MAG: hypothetical protein GY809_05485 [Planctomycetes bacterium]|nr:hypothetical protein [Planctomycetota bacterium]